MCAERITVAAGTPTVCPAGTTVARARHGGRCRLRRPRCPPRGRRSLAPERGFQKVVIDESALVTDDRSQGSGIKLAMEWDCQRLPRAFSLPEQRHVTARCSGRPKSEFEKDLDNFPAGTRRQLRRHRCVPRLRVSRQAEVREQSRVPQDSCPQGEARQPHEGCQLPRPGSRPVSRRENRSTRRRRVARLGRSDTRSSVSLRYLTADSWSHKFIRAELAFQVHKVTVFIHWHKPRVL